MHLICTLRNGMNDRDASKRAAKAGLLAPALSDYFAGEPFRQGLVLGYAGFDETVIDTSIKTLAPGAALEHEMTASQREALECPLWVISRHCARSHARPLCAISRRSSGLNSTRIQSSEKEGRIGFLGSKIRIELIMGDNLTFYSPWTSLTRSSPRTAKLLAELSCA